ncbi:MAG: GGDEF domain-containing protein [Clostridia bacterium]|nr:GGDEF domain-containing protein [Clostridia bacterium]
MRKRFSMFTKIPSDLKEAFIKHYQYENYNRLALFSFFVVIEEIARVFINRSTITDRHLLLNLIMIFSILALTPFAFHVKNHCKENIQWRHAVIMNIIIFLIMLWCVQMTLIEIREANNMNTFTLGAFVIAALAFLHPRFSAFLYGTTLLLFCVQLPLYSTIHFFIDHVIDATFISVIAFSLSHVIFKLKLEVYLDHKIIEENNKALFEKTIRDPMTNLYNHKYSLEILESELLKIPQGHPSPCLLFLDIDHFKRINDNYGHSVGDTTLVNVADVIEKSIRETDFAGRYGGEEFVVIFPETTLEAASKLSESIRKNIANSLRTPNFSITVSGGLIECSDGTVDQNIVAADNLLYKAKKFGRNRIVS